MSIMEKFKGFIGVPEDEYYDDNEIDLIGTDDDLPLGSAHSSGLGGGLRDGVREPAGREFSSSANRVLNIPATTQLQVVLVKPERLEDASTIADYLNERHTVVLNLEAAQKDEARRLLDFLSGVAYANHGKISKVANSTYIITPSNVDIRGELLDELENNGVIF